MLRYKNLQITKHALQYYVQREGASVKDLTDAESAIQKPTDYCTSSSADII